MLNSHAQALAAALPAVIAFAAAPAWGAVGCDLNEPERDVARLFPGSTGYRTVELEIQKLGGNQMLVRIEARMRDQLRGIYETIDVPYTLYVIYKHNEVIGYIHGINQKGQFGGIQVFLVLGLERRIRELYIQKMTGTYAGKFRDRAFEGQFTGVQIEDFDTFDVATGRATGRIAAVKNPEPASDLDFRMTMRGIKKNLILVDEFFRAAPDLASKATAPPRA